jgi:hypothetical protein
MDKRSRKVGNRETMEVIKKLEGIWLTLFKMSSSVGKIIKTVITRMRQAKLAPSTKVSSRHLSIQNKPKTKN